MRVKLHLPLRWSFPTYIRKSEKEPAVSGDYLEFNGACYTLEDGHKDFVADWTGDEHGSGYWKRNHEHHDSE